jgi:hypothetical protein
LLRWRAQVSSGNLLGPRIITCGTHCRSVRIQAAHGPVVVAANASEGRRVVD